MRRLQVLSLLVMFAACSSMLFQNCSEMKSAATDVSNAGNGPVTSGDGNEPDRPIPDVLLNRNIPLDNKIMSGSTSFSVGGDDKFSYETNYRAVYESSLVSIYGESNIAVIEVTVDNCTERRNLAQAEIDEFITLFSSSYNNSVEKVPDASEETIPGCSFPRLLMNATGTNGDVEIYYTPRECTPGHNLHMELNQPNNMTDVSQIIQDTKVFFRGFIDELCPAS